MKKIYGLLIAIFLSISVAPGYAQVSPAPGIRHIYVQTFTANGTYTPHTGLVYAYIQEVGGGGGGGGATGQSPGGGGGGAGECATGWFTKADIGSSQVVTIGIAGTAGTTAGTNGGTGGTTSLGSLLTAVGAGGGVGATGTGHTSNGDPGGSGGTGGTGTGIHYQGAPGTPALYNTGSVFSGMGGTSCLGGGGKGITQGETVSAASGYGGGGAGGMGFGGTMAGVAGQPGEIIVTEFTR